MKLSGLLRGTAAGLALCGAAAFALAPSAVAAPNDLTLTPIVSGNTVSITIANQSAAPVGCTILGFADGADPLEDEGAFGYATPPDLAEFVSPNGGTKTVAMRLEGVDENGDPAPTGSATIPDGTYEIYYGCRQIVGDVEDAEHWGTTPPLTDETETFAPVIRVTVPGDDDPNPPSECSGSLCGLTVADLIAGN